MAVNALIINRTPFCAEKFIFPNQHGQEVTLTVLSATFEVDANGIPFVADQQVPIRTSDVHFGDPATSSVRYEADLALEKAYVDVLVAGNVYAPGLRPAEAVPVTLRAGDIEKQLIVSGDRHWGVTGPSKPQPFESMTMQFERAFGGVTCDADSNEQHMFRQNPVGIGFKGAKSVDPDICSLVPNIEYASARMQSQTDIVPPAGLGCIAKNWLPRLNFAGTFNDEWLENRWPLLPTDFDARFYQCAPPDQQSSTLKGGELIGLLNMHPNGVWKFTLPTLSIPLRYYFDDRRGLAEFKLDTIFLEPDLNRFTLIARASLITTRGRGALREIVIGHMSRGWLRAHAKRKRYIDTAQKQGQSGQPLFKL